MQTNITKLFSLSSLFLSILSTSSLTAPTSDPETVVFKPLKNAKGIIISQPKQSLESMPGIKS
ncbi:hypothetical protein H0A36_27170 [Endozoicomonas sp. SM1973]|uniref:Uncharacterized protein n=1 Tax=Spartinivicinus marinus TaxID=2994442 RepID=A0A853I708_9GAMM|nr:hypothetical protein [Spartinivicinus marinus]MCX4027796.1 hypothetical protein [Spartinivicinus marinus]NYZ69700.1 hypothetical protein [Spartinivicinus marinus]